jgi:chloramphenicol-sensitive protein RarD
VTVDRSARLGALATVLAFFLWGVLPVYWKALLRHVNALEVMTNRVVWTWAAGAIVVSLAGRWGEVRAAFRCRRSIACFLGAACMIGGNWYTFIVAVNAGRVVECSLGYYINPLINVLLGFVVLGERFRRWQQVAILLALAGVLNLTVNYGRFPWFALILAGTFGFYGLLRKTAGYGAVPGLVLETGVLFAPAVAYLLYRGPAQWDALRIESWTTFLLLPATGVVTAIPLVTFAFGARRIRLATVGFIQYLTPTGMFLLGVFLYREPFTAYHLVTFACIWIGLAVYSVDAVASTRRDSAAG